MKKATAAATTDSGLTRHDGAEGGEAKPLSERQRSVRNPGGAASRQRNGRKSARRQETEVGQGDGAAPADVDSSVILLRHSRGRNYYYYVIPGL